MKYFIKTKNSYEEIEPQSSDHRVFIKNNILKITAVLFVAVTVLFLLGIFTVLPFPQSTPILLDTFHESTKNLTEGVEVGYDIIVDLTQGSVLGKLGIPRAGREYLTFLGIPYAKPPLGEFRFQPPLPAEPWSGGTLNATAVPPVCIQRNKNSDKIRVKGSEDCLYVNVYTTKTIADLRQAQDLQKTYPVLVHIHGGGTDGSATKYGPDYFMDEDVVLVTFHYRMGVMGNLNTMDSNARGNQGHKDQVMALKWVNDNIVKFGGNPKTITIFGNSGGGMRVSAHLLSPMSTGLFHRAICQSGVEISPGIFTQNPLELAEELGHILNCPPWNTTADLVGCFRNTSAEDLVRNSYSMDFATSVEPSASSDFGDVFLSDTPLKLLQNGQFNRVPTILGGTASEGLAFALPILSSMNQTEAFNENWAQMASEAIWLDNSPTVKDSDRIAIANAARDFYLASNNSTLNRSVQKNFTAMFSDRRILHPAAVFATFQLNRNRRDANENVYLYYFSEPVDTSYADPKIQAYGGEESFGPAHADELQFLFPHDRFPYIPLGSKNANVSQMLVRLWVSFAANGEPTDTINGAQWLPLEKGKPLQWFDICRNPKMTTILAQRMDFWNSFNLTNLYV